jgi:beta-glucanase (GH16 family)
VSDATARPRRRRWLILSVLAAGLSVLLLAAPAMAASAVDNWTGPSSVFHPLLANNLMWVAKTPGTTDGSALRLQLSAYPLAGPSQGVAIATNKATYQYGIYGTRMKTADCTGQNHPGVVTGTFTYSTDHRDANRNGIPDNSEIDVEFLCGQPNVVWLTLWTDYSETTDALGSITRAIDLQTGTVLENCYLVAYSKPCQPQLPGENSPASVAPIPGFNSAKQFYTYMFDWEPDHVTFYAVSNAGLKTILWDYHGPASRIPQKPSMFMQNVWYTPSWNPLNGPSHNQPTANTSAYIDTSYLPK